MKRAFNSSKKIERYLDHDDFCKLCDAVGLHKCDKYELEDYEREGLMFPVARFVMPDEYIKSYWSQFYSNAGEIQIDDQFKNVLELDRAIRYPPATYDLTPQELSHVIDRSWGNIDCLIKPSEEIHKPWSDYFVYINPDIKQSTAYHFYHYWQIYELYEIRRFKKGKYSYDKSMLYPDSLEYGQIKELAIFLDVISYFDRFYSLRRYQITRFNPPNADGFSSYEQNQLIQLEQETFAIIEPLLQQAGLDKDRLYAGLRGMMYLHYAYIEAEKLKLAECMRDDIARMSLLISLTTGAKFEEIIKIAGKLATGYRRNYLEVVFPNQRKLAREEAKGTILSVIQNHNQHAKSYMVTEEIVTELLDYCEKSDLALFTLILEKINQDFFDLENDWYYAASFLNIKTLASFPETLLKNLIANSGDLVAKNLLQDSRNGLTNFIENLLTRHPINGGNSGYGKLVKKGNHSAIVKTEFIQKFDNLNNNTVSSDENKFLASNLCLTTLLRNFTSHRLLEDQELFKGRYRASVRAIMSSIFLIWLIAKQKGWLSVDHAT